MVCTDPISFSVFESHSLNGEPHLNPILNTLIYVMICVFVRVLHFTKFLTIHQENWNQIYNQWCSLNDRSEVYSKDVYMLI